MSLKDKTIVVTGGSRGLGLGLVEALVGQGAKVTVVARDPAALAAVEQRLGVATISADVTDKGHARRILADVRPEILVLNAGATPRMGRLDQLSWADFTATWETGVKAGLYCLQAALAEEMQRIRTESRKLVERRMNIGPVADQRPAQKRRMFEAARPAGQPLFLEAP